MKKIMSIIAIALMMAGSMAFACDSCGCADKKAEKAECCGKDGECCKAEKECKKCDEEKACKPCEKKAEAEAKKAEATE